MSKSSKSPATAQKSFSDKEIAARNAAALARVGEMSDPDKLRALMANAERMNVIEVRDAAFRRLALVQAEAPEDAPEAGTLDHDLWQTIHAYEQLLREDRGRAQKLTRTRMRLSKAGAVKALEGFATATDETPGFDVLVTRGLADLTGEAVILRHPEGFDAATRDAAAERLEKAGADPARAAA